jgi:hypothetical protein
MGKGVSPVTLWRFDHPALIFFHSTAHVSPRILSVVPSARLSLGDPNFFVQRQYIVGTFACIGGGLFGLDISSMSAVLNVSLTRIHFDDALMTLS